MLDAAQAGDPSAFEALYDSLNQRVAAFATARGASDPEGLVNEVFLRVFRTLSKFEGHEAQFNAWVFAIARHLVIDECRASDRRPKTDSGSPIPELASAHDVANEAVGRLGNASLLSLVDELTDDQRDVVLLRVVADLTVETIAGVLDKQPGAVKALQRRAFRRLAKRIQEQNVRDSVATPVPL